MFFLTIVQSVWFQQSEAKFSALMPPIVLWPHLIKPPQMQQHLAKKRGEASESDVECGAHSLSMNQWCPQNLIWVVKNRGTDVVLDGSRGLSLDSGFVHLAPPVRKRKGKDSPGTQVRESRCMGVSGRQGWCKKQAAEMFLYRMIYFDLWCSIINWESKLFPQKIKLTMHQCTFTFYPKQCQNQSKTSAFQKQIQNNIWVYFQFIDIHIVKITQKGNCNEPPLLLIRISSQTVSPSSFLHEEFQFQMEKHLRSCRKAPGYA